LKAPDLQATNSSDGPHYPHGPSGDYSTTSDSEAGAAFTVSTIFSNKFSIALVARVAVLVGFATEMIMSPCASNKLRVVRIKVLEYFFTIMNI
jgi:hypothetical protein